MRDESDQIELLERRLGGLTGTPRVPNPAA